MRKLIFISLSLLTPFLHSADVASTTPAKAIEISALVERKMTVHDEKRNKDLEVVIWSSGDFKASEKKPLILLSHGLNGNPVQLSWLTKDLVQAGYIVAATTHQDVDAGSKAHIDHWNRPLDISAMLTGVLESPMGQFIDKEKIGMAGYSLGGSTSLWIAGGISSNLDPIYPGPEYASEKAFNNINELAKTMDRAQMTKDYRDPRIKAVFMMAPAWGWVYNQESLGNISIPVFIVAGDKDELINSEKNAEYLAKNIPHAKYEKVEGAGHSIFVEGKPDQPSNEAFLTKTSKEAVEFFSSSLK